MEAAIIHTLRYFSRFAYAPTLEELHLFLSVKISHDQLKKILNENRFKYMDSRLSARGGSPFGRRGNENIKVTRYVLRERADDLHHTFKKAALSETKIGKIRSYVRMLAWFPQIRLIGLSGSVAMRNAEADDDIDLFVITARRRMWTARLICFLLSQLLGIRRRRTASAVQDTVCHNLFFDETDLELPVKKRTEYGAHEVLQMKPLVSKDTVYERFLKANDWIYALFPNARGVSSHAESAGGGAKDLKRFHDLRKVEGYRSNQDFTPLRMAGYIFDKVERILGWVQRTIINKHRSTELITDSQLWFFPDDFEAKIH